MSQLIAIASSIPRSYRRLAIAFVAAALIPLLGYLILYATNGFYVAEDPNAALRVTGTRPSDGERDVAPNGFVAADVHLPNPGHGVDARTVSPQSVRLFRSIDGEPIEAVINTSGAGDSIVLQPVEPLAPKTSYTFEVTAELKDTSGHSFAPYKVSFTTAAGANLSAYPVAFEKVQLLTPREVFTGLALGPDHRLYAGTFDGKILRFEISADGTLNDPTVISTVQSQSDGPRLITGIHFDPASTPANLILWVSHGVMALENAVDWSGRISRLHGEMLDQYEDVVVGLPRGYRDHLNNQLDFGPDGAIYFNQGSMTATGAPDAKWNFRDEHLLTAAILRLDPKPILGTLDVKSEDGGTYDPYAPGAPLTIYATGVRVGFDTVWHSNGHLYVPINGSARGGNTPAGADGRVPPLHDVSTQPDFLLSIEKGGYYGHPNPARGEYVLNGGNPTTRVDPAEVSEYPVGTKALGSWRRAAYDFGKSVSPNGIIEYHSDAFGGRLRGKLLVTRFSGGDDIMVLTPGANGQIVESMTGIDGLIKFVDPLDLIEDRATGNVYVAEFGGQKLTLLRPRSGADQKPSRRVFRQEIIPTPSFASTPEE